MYNIYDIYDNNTRNDKLNTFNEINVFTDLYHCNNLYICIIGLFFPYCLFGKTYERGDYGNFYGGCCRLFSIHCILSSIVVYINLVIYNNLILTEQSVNEAKINLCNDNKSCFTNSSIYSLVILNDCNYISNIAICTCLKNSLLNQCIFNNNLPNLIDNVMYYMYIISIIGIFVIYVINGLFLGNFRYKISYKYNILSTNRYNFLIHCCPFTHHCALCQEYNTVNMIEVFRPFNPVDIKFSI